MFHHTYLVYRYEPRADRHEKRLVAKYAIVNGEFMVLSDYVGLFHGMEEGKLTPKIQRALERIGSASYYEIVQRPAYRKGTAPPEETPDATAAVGEDVGTKARPSVFEYLREGMDRPHRLEIAKSRVVLDGNTLTPDEAQRILSEARSGLATIRYVKDMETSIHKAEANLFGLDLQKTEGFGASWEALRGLVDKGHLSHDHFDALRRELYVDEMVPGVGNKRAFLEHLNSGPRTGVYAALDANHLKAINDALGHEAGDSAIKATGNAMRAAIDGTVGSGKAKSWRVGGDEFYLHANSHDEMAQILRHLRGGLEAVPPLGGTHKLSVSVGLGPDHLIADQALYHAKGAKEAKIRALGGDPEDRKSPIRAPDAMYAHSLHPGHEGPLAVETERAPSVPKPMPQEQAQQPAQ